MSEQWYALRSKPNKEESLSREVTRRGMEVFFPQIKVKPVNPRSRKVRAYFPGYMFVRVDLAEVGYSALAWIPYSAGLVAFGGEASPVPDGLIQEIRRRVEQINFSGGELLESLHPGDAVVIEEGPLAGYQAIFDAKLSGSERVRVLLQLLKGQQVAVTLPPGFVKKKPKHKGL